MTRSTRTAQLTVLLAAALLMATPAAADDWDFGVRAGWYVDDVEGPFVGIEALTQIGDTQWWFNPNVEAAFGDDLDVVSASADAHYDFETDGPAIWAGAGLSVLRFDPRIGDKETELGVNGLIGIGAKRGAFRPFAQAKVILSEETELVLMGGVRF